MRYGVPSAQTAQGQVTPKLRVQRALKHDAVDRLPTQINYTDTMGRQLAAHYGVPLEMLPGYLGNHLLRVDIDYKGKTSADQRVKFDWWGVGFNTLEEGYFDSVNPLAENKDLEAHTWPNPTEPGLLDQAARAVAEDGEQHFVVPNFGFALFERAWALRGLGTFLMDMVLDQGYAQALLERITVIQEVLVQRFIDLGVDGAYFGDDYGAQKNMLISPVLWRRMIKPRLARLFEPFRKAGLPIILHSDGQIAPILPDLVEIGVNVLNPVQPEVLDQGWLKQTFGGGLAYYGGISTQTVLPYGSPGEVRQAVRDAVKALADGGSGLLLAPSHRMMGDIPLENVDALLLAFSEFGTGILRQSSSHI